MEKIPDKPAVSSAEEQDILRRLEECIKAASSKSINDWEKISTLGTDFEYRDNYQTYSKGVPDLLEHAVKKSLWEPLADLASRYGGTSAFSEPLLKLIDKTNDPTLIERLTRLVIESLKPAKGSIRKKLSSYIRSSESSEAIEFRENRNQPCNPTNETPAWVSALTNNCQEEAVNLFEPVQQDHFLDSLKYDSLVNFSRLLRAKDMCKFNEWIKILDKRFTRKPNASMALLLFQERKYSRELSTDGRFISKLVREIFLDINVVKNLTGQELMDCANRLLSYDSQLLELCAEQSDWALILEDVLEKKLYSLTTRGCWRIWR